MAKSEFPSDDTTNMPKMDEWLAANGQPSRLNHEQAARAAALQAAVFLSTEGDTETQIIEQAEEFKEYILNGQT